MAAIRDDDDDEAKPTGSRSSKSSMGSHRSRGERVEAAEPSQKPMAREVSTSALAPPEGERHSSTASRHSSTGPADEGVLLEQLSGMSQELANTKMSMQEAEAELKKLRAAYEKLTAEKDALATKSQQQEKELTSIKQAVVFESVEKGQLEVRKLRGENVRLESKVTELTEANSKLEQTLTQKSADLQKSQEQEKKLTVAMVDYQQLQQREAAASAELASASSRLTNVAQNEESKLAAQRSVHLKELDNLRQTHLAEVTKLKEESAKWEESSGAFKRKAEGLAKDLKKQLAKGGGAVADPKDDELKVENGRLKEELQRKSKSLADAMQELLHAGGGGEERVSKLQQQLENAKKQLGTVHEKELTIQHLKSANVILSERVVSLEAQLKGLGVSPPGSRLVTSSSSFKAKASPRARQEEEEEDLP